MTNKPKRRYQIELTLGADSLRDVIGALNGLVYELHAKKEDDPIQTVTGGYSHGYVLTADINTDITHETWEVALKDYLAAQKAEPDEVK